MTKKIALHCMKSASELRGELCEECQIYGQTGSDHCYEDALRYVIDMLEQEPNLDKIRAEIEELDRYYDNDYFSGNRDAMYKCNDVLQIIDKYKTESEDEK